jgi:drug/metabolite transporter (DMT)-like permease
MIRYRAFDWLVLGFLVVAWGSAFAALKVAVEAIPPLWNTAIRLTVALPVLGLVMAARGERLPSLQDPAWRHYLAIGFVGMAAPFALYAYSAHRLPSAINAICNGAATLFTALFSHMFLTTERLSLRQAAGVAVGFSGIVVLVAPKVSQGLGVEALALAAAILGAVLYAAANIITKRAPAVSSVAGALMMCATGAAFAWAAALTLEPVPPWPPAASLAAVVSLGVIQTALATIGYVYLVQVRGPVFMSMAIYLAPLWATGLGVVLMGEQLHWTAFAALALVLSGVVLANLRRAS